MLNTDCIEFMASCKDKDFSLAIVDVPYGINEATEQMHTRHHSQKKYAAKQWDNASPETSYFLELQRVSKNQIVWGANHFISKIPIDSSCWIFWDKDGFGDFADGELAWTSFSTAVRKFKYTWNGFRKQNPEHRIHPTQKPVALYRWLLKNYAKEGDRILDTHGGSFSSAIAVHQMNQQGMNLSYVGMEIDKDYFEAAKKRFDLVTSQTSLTFAE